VTEREARQDARDELPLDDVIEIQGDSVPVDQDGILDPDELEHERSATRTELDAGYTIPDRAYAGGQESTLDDLDLDDLRDGETDDPGVASQEGLTYIPPTDPPAVSDEEAVGSDVNVRIREALRADSQTSVLEDRLIVGTRGSVAVIRGVIDDVDDSDSIIEVVSRVRGISDVVDETELAG
jgi:hypothetical protein